MVHSLRFVVVHLVWIVVGASVVGSLVVGSLVVGLLVVGATVVGSLVVGPLVVGSFVMVTGSGFIRCGFIGRGLAGRGLVGSGLVTEVAGNVGVWVFTGDEPFSHYHQVISKLSFYILLSTSASNLISLKRVGNMLPWT